MKWLAAFIAIAGTAFGLAVVTSPAGGVEQRLPDLRPLPRYLADNSIGFEGSTKVLRFSNGIANFGQGPLNVRGGRATTSDPMLATQRVALVGGGYVDLPAGELTYHPAHNHWHFNDVADYELLDQSGNVVGSTLKAGFCLLDVAKARPWVPFPSVYGNCNQGNQNALTIGPQGISVGWTDVYDQFTSGQSIDITGVPPGQYTLRCTIDPLNHLAESDDTNNSTQVPVTIP